MTAVVWFRRDLRLADHPALCAALNSAETVVPVFCLDDSLLAGRHASGPRTQFMLDCLADLDGALRARGSALVVRHGPPEHELAQVAARVRATAVHVSDDISPFARRRDGRVQARLAASGVVLHRHAGLGAVDDPAALRTTTGGPYKVFSAYHRRWELEARRAVCKAPSALPALPSRVRLGRIPTLQSLGLHSDVAAAPRGGAAHAHAMLGAFLRDASAQYTSGHDALAADGTSRLSPYLRFGCLSVREVEALLGDDEGSVAFRRQLCWRDFYAQLLSHFPANATTEFQARYRRKVAWSRAAGRFAAWCEGRTGYPLVDAAMRQLRGEGWMHNRGRLVVGSFLTKDLGIDWRWGERHFMRLLLDGDQASNNGNWQWIASVGADRQPISRRILSPTRQMEAHDPDGRYVRRHVPELAVVPDGHLREPWTMPRALQRQVGCVIGVDYPAPIVDHAQARRRALERYRVP